MGAAASGPRRRLCFPGRYYEYMFGHSRRRTWGRRPLAARGEPEMFQLQVVIEAGDPGCDGHPHLTSSEACEYRSAAAALLLPGLGGTVTRLLSYHVSRVEVSRFWGGSLEELESKGSRKRAKSSSPHWRPEDDSFSCCCGKSQPTVNHEARHVLPMIFAVQLSYNSPATALSSIRNQR